MTKACLQGLLYFVLNGYLQIIVLTFLPASLFTALQLKCSTHSRLSPPPPTQARVLPEVELCFPGGQGAHLQQVFLEETVMLSKVLARNSKPETGYPTDLASPASWALCRPRELWREGTASHLPFTPPSWKGSPSPVTGSEGSCLADTQRSRDRERLQGARGWPLSKDRAGMESQGAERKLHARFLM